MLLNTITPNILVWLRLLCFEQCKRAKMRRTAVTQYQLNQSYSGRVFKLEYRYPTVLNVLFVTLLYSAGMPILYPLAAVTFTVLYLTDKVALLRLYNRPPKYKASLAKLAYAAIPFAILLHLAFATWMFGSDFLDSHPVSAEYAESVGAASSTGDGGVASLLEGGSTSSGNATDEGGASAVATDLGSRISRLNGFLPFFALLVFSALMVLRVVVWWWIASLAGCVVSTLTCGKCGSGLRTMRKRKHLPGFTEPLVMYVADREQASLSHLEKTMGWIVKSNDDGIMQRKKLWMQDGVTHGMKHKKGQAKSTWEVIRDTALHTYDIASNPHYEEAFAHRKPSTAVEGAAQTA